MRPRQNFPRVPWIPGRHQRYLSTHGPRHGHQEDEASNVSKGASEILGNDQLLQKVHPQRSRTSLSTLRGSQREAQVPDMDARMSNGI